MRGAYRRQSARSASRRARASKGDCREQRGVGRLGLHRRHGTTGTTAAPSRDPRDAPQGRVRPTTARLARQRRVHRPARGAPARRRPDRSCRASAPGRAARSRRASPAAAGRAAPGPGTAPPRASPAPAPSTSAGRSAAGRSAPPAVKQVAAEQRPGRGLEQQPALPVVRQVGVSSQRTPPAQRQLLAVGQRARRPIGQVVHRDHRRGRAAHRLGAGRDREPVVQRAALVGLHVREGRRSGACAASPRTWATASRTSGNIRRSPVWKRSGASSTIRNWLKVKPPGMTVDGGADAVDAVGDLVDARAGFGVGDAHGRCGSSAPSYGVAPEALHGAAPVARAGPPPRPGSARGGGLLPRRPGVGVEVVERRAQLEVGDLLASPPTRAGAVAGATVSAVPASGFRKCRRRSFSRSSRAVPSLGTRKSGSMPRSWMLRPFGV